MLSARSGKRSNVWRSGFILVAVVLLGAASVAFAQTADQPPEQGQNKEEKKSYLYEWTDSKGVVHITDSLGAIPEKYREKARKLQSPEGEAPGGGEGQSLSPGGGESSDSGQKSVWQQRMRQAKQRLADAESRYRDLDKRRSEMLSRWGTPAYAPPEVRLEAERIAKEQQDVQKEIDDARNEIENVIPEDARKQGIPPGWLRE